MKYLLTFVSGLIFLSCGTGSKSVVAQRNSISLKINEKATYENVVITLKK
ncbi:hypothetical protein [Niabella ginsengisoli]|uniref:Uncharacterized protein n=1 Tax=Niabella ginsengisoli TaxID=522298 RepID=A0ABS9SQS5_9BACT|nr:hypothetical protein [Niabella ginsengisoli]MCH5600753.1 hypothetical protein [Niabella ginsengisoli]